jgi:acyl-CoA hydrolase
MPAPPIERRPLAQVGRLAVYSGIGGQVNFLRGASMAKGGKAILALTSTAKNGAVSRITPMLEPGAGVVTTRGLVRYVVTEFGTAYLHGLSIRQRAEALIQIAHPKFRRELYDYCERHRWLPLKPAAAYAISAR